MVVSPIEIGFLNYILSSGHMYSLGFLYRLKVK